MESKVLIQEEMTNKNEVLFTPLKRSKEWIESNQRESNFAYGKTENMTCLY